MVDLTQQSCNGGLTCSGVAHEDGMVGGQSAGVESQLAPLNIEVHVVGNGGETALDVVESYHGVELGERIVVGRDLCEERLGVDVVGQHLDIGDIDLAAADLPGQPLTVVRSDVAVDEAVEVGQRPPSDDAMLVGLGELLTGLFDGFGREVEMFQNCPLEKPEDDFLEGERLDAERSAAKQVAQGGILLEDVVNLLLCADEQHVAAVPAELAENLFAAIVEQGTEVVQAVDRRRSGGHLKVQRVVGRCTTLEELVELLVGVIDGRVVERGAVDEAVFAVEFADIPEEQEGLADHGVAPGIDEEAVVTPDALDAFDGEQLRAEVVHRCKLCPSDGFLAELAQAWSGGEHHPHTFLHAESGGEQILETEERAEAWRCGGERGVRIECDVEPEHLMTAVAHEQEIAARQPYRRLREGDA